MTTGRNSGRSVAIAGGGIAGLAAALCFARSGAQVSVFERAPELREFGAGLQITPNGACVLRHLGLSEAADRAALRADAVVPTDALTGRAIARFDLTQLRTEPYRFFHRSDLLGLLADACAAAGVDIRTGATVEAATQDGQLTVNGQVQGFDVIVGADGLHSVVRPVLNGADAPFFTGQVAWRTVVAAQDSSPEARIWMAPGQHVVTYPLTGGLLNVVAVQEQSAWVDEGWRRTDSPENLMRVFGRICNELRGVLSAADQVGVWGLFRHPVAEAWHGGRLAIIGDAAHPTLPFLAQGANLALEDAFVVAECLNRCDDIQVGLARFEAERQGRVRRAIAAANANARNYHLRGPARRVAHMGLKTLGIVAPQQFLRRMDWLYGFDVTLM